MISHVPGPIERLAWRLHARWERWMDGHLADAPVERRPAGGTAVQAVLPVQMPPLRGIQALIARCTDDGLSQREIARRLNTSKSTVQRAQVLAREMATG
ncbi:MAG: hypothetical protein CMJ46_00610 [Planctomyces sp.]|nr:hypothetical protein [Planctomyces sp.]